MSYANKYNTRHSGRYNTPGQFVSAGEMGQQQHQSQQHLPSQQLFGSQAPAQVNPNLQPIQAADVEMKQETETGTDDAPARPHWMKSKLAGVKKVSNKERRRRQNETLRRLLSPKNALMVLNEMLPGEQLTSQFKVEAASQYFSKLPGQNSFCADLTLDGQNYKGYGENKLTARNAAAEQAIRDLVIKRMNKALAAEADKANSESGATTTETDGEADEEALPMMQLASFALYKLFSGWEYEGHKVPQLKPSGGAVGAAGAAGALGGGEEAVVPRPAAPRAPRPPAALKTELPDGAAQMHPCTLLAHMRPHKEYRELAVEGDRPQTMMFTMGVDIEGVTYIGKAANKKEARKQAARAAIQALFGFRYEDASG